jgi:hypothetical protein
MSVIEERDMEMENRTIRELKEELLSKQEQISQLNE